MVSYRADKLGHFDKGDMHGMFMLGLTNYLHIKMQHKISSTQTTLLLHKYLTCILDCFMEILTKYYKIQIYCNPCSWGLAVRYLNKGS